MIIESKNVVDTAGLLIWYSTGSVARNPGANEKVASVHGSRNSTVKSWLIVVGTPYGVTAVVVTVYVPSMLMSLVKNSYKSAESKNWMALASVIVGEIVMTSVNGQ